MSKYKWFFIDIITQLNLIQGTYRYWSIWTDIWFSVLYNNYVTYYFDHNGGEIWQNNDDLHSCFEQGSSCYYKPPRHDNNSQMIGGPE